MWSYSSLLVGPSIPSCSTQRLSMEEWSKERQSTSARQVLEQMSSETVRTLIIFVVSRPAWARGEKGVRSLKGDLKCMCVGWDLEYVSVRIRRRM